MQTYTASTASFVDTLYQRAESYFKTQPNGQYATPLVFVISFFFLVIYAGAYSMFLFGSYNFPSLLGWASLIGVCHVLIPVTIAHDAIHQSLSPKAWVNQLGLLSMELTGANSYMYKKKHLEAHRNKEQGHKANTIETQMLLLQKTGKNKTVNLPYLFYLLYAEYMIFVRDFQLFNRESAVIPKKEWRRLVASKIMYAVAFLVLPFICITLPAWQIVCAILLIYLIVTVLLVIILLMPTGKMEQSRLLESNSYNDQWAVEILAHYVDFSPGNRLLNLLGGGANLNVVHYLFPGVNHVHYNKLAGLVEATAIEYGLCYRKQNVKDVVGIHLSYIKNIQGQESSVVIKTD